MLRIVMQCNVCLLLYQVNVRKMLQDFVNDSGHHDQLLHKLLSWSEDHNQIDYQIDIDI